MLEPELQSLEDELARVEVKYKDILAEINKKFRQEVRAMGVKKNVVPIKYILPEEYINRLLEYPPFKRAWQRKALWIYLKRDDEREGHWIRVQAFPNIGGVPVEEGPELKVVVERIPRRKRRRKENVRENENSGRDTQAKEIRD